ncbi:MAG: exopolysaccharide production protein ExoZ [Oceanicaulis sp. HLUCCA04]|nr:MAG: exopolysaccharide production protein ExoZ [Oceanicaulis sp. HLUCCA04]
MRSAITSLQGLRALAALLVLAGHTAQLEGRFLPDPILGDAWLLGFGGVDLFFVISGFVMVYITWGAPRGQGSIIGRFVYARATRVYPAYWLYTVLALAAYMIIPGSLNRDLADLELWRSFTLWPIAGDLPVLHVGWTLSHEMYFYLVFAALLALPARFLPWLLAMWGALAALAGSLIPELPAIGALITHPLTLEFILGAFAGLLVCSGRRKFAYPVLAAAAIWLTVAAVVLWPQSEADFPGGWARVAAFGIPSALIVYAIVSLEADGQFTAPQWLIDLGDWSYALYLSHLLVLSAAVRVWASAVPNIGVAGNLAFITLATATCIAAAWASYRFFEIPVLNATRAIGDRLFTVPPRTGSPGMASRIW